MTSVACPCGVVFEYSPGPGRPRTKCDGCRKHGYEKRPPRVAECARCGAEAAGRKYCSDACKHQTAWERRRRNPCTACGEPLGWAANDPRPRDGAMHPRCRPIDHGTTSGYSRGCRCQECRAAQAAYCREYAQRVRVRDGVSLSTKYGHSGGGFIKRAERLKIYDRDGWTCQLCGTPVDPNAVRNSWGEATLDHIEPQTHALIPDHRPENLRMAHRGCNSARGNRVTPPAP